MLPWRTLFLGVEASRAKNFATDVLPLSQRLQPHSEEIERLFRIE
jgi:hypothetical protein